MIPTLNVILNTANTINQGGMCKGGKKLSDEYKEVTAVCFMNQEDWEFLNKPEKVEVSTEEGSIVLFARVDKGVRKGEIFIPRGIWANIVISSETYNTGTPMYKNMNAKVCPSDKEVLSVREVIEKYYKK